MARAGAGTAWARVREDLATQGGRLRSPGFRALLVHRFGAWRHQVRLGPVRKALRPVYEVLRRRIRGRYGVELHHSAVIGRRVCLPDAGGVVVGKACVVGDDTVLGPGVTMAKTRVGRPGRPVVGARVVVGPGAAFVGGVQVGDDAVIGPNAVVISDVAPGTTVLAPASSLVDADEAAGAVAATGVVDGLAPLEPRQVPAGVRIGPSVRASRAVPPRFLGAVEVGEGCMLHERVTLGWAVPDGDTPGATRLGARVELLPGAVVQRGVSIGDDARIGPNAVVEVDVPPGGVVLAAPVRVISGSTRS